ncbi:MAG: hypothetical protein ACE5NN_00765 [Candidatus Bathyarchaeia archaeon]
MKGPQRIKVVPLTFESLGVRSMCTYVETPDIKILLDAGVSLGPRRYRLPPHPMEYKALKRGREKILEVAEKADAVTVSHYHFDHQTPSYTDWAYNWSSAEIADRIYGGKLVFMKSYRSYVNFSQRRRGWMFVKTSGRKADRLEVSDGRSFKFGDTELGFSTPVFHGEENSQLGWLIMTTIEYNKAERVLFASDVQGPMSNETLSIILAEKPHVLIVGGPPLYLAGMVKKESLAIGFKNLEKIAEKVPLVILEHHLLRDKEWRTKAQQVFDIASRSGHRVVTAAEFVGEKNQLLEAHRDELYDVDPPSQEFLKWTKIPALKRKLTPPPI